MPSPLVKDFSLDRLNSFKLTCQAAYYMAAKTNEDVFQGLEYAAKEELDVVPMGEGTNIILSPSLSAVCLHIQTKKIELLEEGQQVLLRVSAGENWHRLVDYTLCQGYFGLENLALIPGNVGAAPMQNIGAYGCEVKDFIDSLDAVEIASGKVHNFRSAECGFSYRSSNFKTKWRDRYIILQVVFRLNKKADINSSYDSLKAELEQAKIANPQPRDIFNAVSKLRRSRLPTHIGNVGSFFHNPTITSAHFAKLKKELPQLKAFALGDGKVRVAAGSLIEACGWKGHKDENVAVYHKHALCLINRGKASQKDVITLADKIIVDIKKRFGISLAIEPRIY